MDLSKCLVFLVAALLSCIGAEKVCRHGWSSFEGSCYKVEKTGLSSEDADRHCDHQGGYLAEPSSESKMKFVVDLITGRPDSDQVKSAWVGAARKRGHFYDWHWKHSRADISSKYLDQPDTWTPHRCGAITRDQGWNITYEDCEGQNETRAFVCQKDEIELTCRHGSCYEIERRTVIFERAEKMCAVRGAKVVEINSSEEQDVIDEILETFPTYWNHVGVWIGATREGPDVEFSWNSDRSSLTYNNWLEGQPDNNGVELEENCVVLDGPNGWQWNDVECYRRHRVICEKEM